MPVWTYLSLIVIDYYNQTLSITHFKGCMIIYSQRNLSLLAEQTFYKGSLMIEDLLHMLWKYVKLGSDCHV